MKLQTAVELENHPMIAILQLKNRYSHIMTD